jgi:hydroxyethylthiazole kinase-like uncharacterized protein yjeF
MNTFNPEELKKLYIPPLDSHKGQNGKLMIIGGSHLFHAASLWALQIASRVVDMVFYSSVPENNKIVEELKKEFRNGIIVTRNDIESYIDESEAVLIGPGMLRSENVESESKSHAERTLEQINKLEDEGEQSYWLTKYLLEKYPRKKWIIDAGALQMIEPDWLIPLNGNVIITPHPIEFERVFKVTATEEAVSEMATKYNVTILLKGEKDIICSSEKCVAVGGGNAGMTKGGTGDVLAGLVASLATKNDLWLAATAGSFFNKKAGESLFEKVGYYFNASDLADEIPVIMKNSLPYAS